MQLEYMFLKLLLSILYCCSGGDGKRKQQCNANQCLLALGRQDPWLGEASLATIDPRFGQFLANLGCL